MCSTVRLRSRVIRVRIVVRIVIFEIGRTVTIGILKIGTATLLVDIVGVLQGAGSLLGVAVRLGAPHHGKDLSPVIDIVMTMMKMEMMMTIEGREDQTAVRMAGTAIIRIRRETGVRVVNALVKEVLDPLTKGVYNPINHVP